MSEKKPTSEFHGWSYKNRNLYIGNLPRRKGCCLYTIRGSVLTVLAYFRNKEAAIDAMNVIDLIASFTTERQ